MVFWHQEPQGGGGQFFAAEKEFDPPVERKRAELVCGQGPVLLPEPIQHLCRLDGVQDRGMEIGEGRVAAGTPSAHSWLCRKMWAGVVLWA